MGEFTIQFDLPPLDDTNSILLPSEPPKPAISSSSSSSKTASLHTPTNNAADEPTSVFRFELLCPEQLARLPVDWNVQKKENSTSAPTYTVPDFKVLCERKKLEPAKTLMPAAGLPLLNDSSIPCQIYKEEANISETTLRWRTAFLAQTPTPIHECAAKFADLLDSTHDGTPKFDFSTKAAEQTSNCVLTSTCDSISPLSFNAAMTENPLLNALAVTALSSSWLDVSPTFFRHIIDAIIFRYRRTQPNYQQGRILTANFCVEDSTASTASFSAELPFGSDSTNEEKAAAVFSPWNSANFYYSFFAKWVAGAIKSQFTGEPFDEKKKEERLSALEVALASHPSVRIFSMRDSAKSITTMHDTFIHPQSKQIGELSNNALSEALSASATSATILNKPSLEFIAESTTLDATFKTLARIDLERSVPRDDLEKLIASNDVPNVPNDVFSLSKVVVTGHFTEWRMLVDRLKVQLRDVSGDLKTWLGAMLWMVLHFCKIRDNYKSPDDHYCPTLVTDGDLKCLRLAVGEKLANLFCNEPVKEMRGDFKPSANVGDVAAFLERFFWFDPKTNRAGGLALLMFPFETGLFLSIPNNDPATQKLFPVFNGSLLRTLQDLVPHGFIASNIFDVRTRCQYRINSSYWQIERAVTSGAAGYLVSSQHFSTLFETKNNMQLIRVVFAAFDTVVSMQTRELLHRLPDVTSKSVSEDSIDRSLERFAVFPQLAKKSDGQFAVTFTSQDSNGRAGFDLCQVGRALSAATADSALGAEVFNQHLEVYKKNKTQTVAEVIACQKKQAQEAQEAQELAEMEQKKAEKQKFDAELALRQQKEKAAKIEADRVAQQKAAKIEADRAAQQKAAKIEADRAARSKPDVQPKRKNDRLQKDVNAQKKAEANPQATVPKPKEKKVKAVKQLQTDADLARELQRLELSASSAVPSFDGDFITITRKGGKRKAAVITKPPTPDVSTVSLPVEPTEKRSVIDQHVDFSDQSMLEKAKTISTVEEKTANIFAAASTVLVAKALPSHDQSTIAEALPPHDQSAIAEALPTRDQSAILVAEALPSLIDGSKILVAEALPSRDDSVSPIKNQTKSTALTENSATVLVDDKAEKQLDDAVALPTDSNTAMQVAPPNVSVDLPNRDNQAPSVSTTVGSEPPVAENQTLPDQQLATANSFFYSLPSDQIIDNEALKRYLQGMRANVSYTRLWLQLACQSRPFSHEKHVLYAERVPITQDQALVHMLNCSDGNCRMQTPWSLLASAFDAMVLNLPPGASFKTLLIGGSPNFENDSVFSLLSSVGKFIFQSVINVAAYSLVDTRSNPDCATCHLCRTAAWSRFCFIPQYIDNKHTVATRMVAMCLSDKCSEELLNKVDDRSHEGGVAKFPGLRVFFNFDNTITVCESESDSFQYILGLSKTAPASPVAFSNADFSLAAGVILISDANGHIFALPPSVAQKAYHLGQFLLTDL